MTDLIERLRGHRRHPNNPNGNVFHEAADRIEELEAENERLRKKLEIAGAHPFPKDFDALDLAVERNKALLAENKRLRGALKWIRENVKVSADRALAALTVVQ
jgi:hypothetical protein